MTAPDQTSVDIPVLTFGGRVTQYDPQTLPSGASPFNHDVAFSGVSPDGVGTVAGLFTRPGISSFYPNVFAGNPTVNYLKTFVDSQTIYHLLSLDGLGNMRDESPCTDPPGPAPTIIGTVVAASMAQSDSLLNREWIAISSAANGFGIDIPRQWNGRFFDRVSQCGPGAGPDAADDLSNTNNLFSVAQYSDSATILSEIGNVVTVSPGSQGGFVAFRPDGTSIFEISLIQIGDSINISGTGTAYDGTWPVSGIVQSGTSPNGPTFDLQYINPTIGLAPTPGATLETGITEVNWAADVSIPAAANFFNITACTTDAGYVGSWPIRYVLNASTDTLWIAVSAVGLPNGSSASIGTVIFPGNISQGVHQVAVSFVTETDYITKPSPPMQWQARGGYRVKLTNIPIGPPNVTSRIVMFTPTIIPPATAGSFYYFDGPVSLTQMNPSDTAPAQYPTMVIPDNITTTAIFDFSDAVLQQGTLADNLFNLVELGEVSHFTAYSGRLFACGERNKIQNFLNLTFDGGFLTNYPLGWTKDPTNGVGGGSSATPYWGGAWRITGDGNAAHQGMITQGAIVDYLGVTILDINTAYSVRVRLQKGAGTAAGTVHIDIVSPTAGLLGAFTQAQAGITGKYTEFIGALLPSLAVLPADAVLRVYVTGLNNGGYVDIDCIEVFPTLIPYNTTTPRASYAEDPESFDGTTGFQFVGSENGFVLRTAFNLLDGYLYYVKDTGLYSTKDDGSNEPALWPVNTVSQTMGTSSPRGVGVGESWAIIAHKTGAYIFWGGEPVKISQEIQPDWDTINWDAGTTIYVVVDTTNKRIHIGAPVGAATTPNVEFVCDYSQLANSEGQTSGQDIAAHPQAYYSVYNPTKVVAPGKARKWTLWNLTANSAALTIRSDGSYHFLRGNGTGTGKIYDQLYTNTSDDGNAIDSQYQTAYLPQPEDEQALQLGTHRKYFKYMSHYSYGSGNMSWNILGPQNQRSMGLQTISLSNPMPFGDVEMNINWVGERASFLFGTFSVGSWFKIVKLSATLQREIFTPIRGVN